MGADAATRGFYIESKHAAQHVNEQAYLKHVEYVSEVRLHGVYVSGSFQQQKGLIKTTSFSILSTSCLKASSSEKKMGLELTARCTHLASALAT